MNDIGPKIYVVSLAHEAAGRSHGVWIDCADGDAERIDDEIDEMLLDSPELESDGYAIRDSKGFGILPLPTDDDPSVSEIVELVRMLKSYGGAIEAFATICAGFAVPPGWDPYFCEENFHYYYRGKWDSVRTWWFEANTWNSQAKLLAPGPTSLVGAMRRRRATKLHEDGLRFEMERNRILTVRDHYGGGYYVFSGDFEHPPGWDYWWEK